MRKPPFGAVFLWAQIGCAVLPPIADEVRSYEIALYSGLPSP